MPVSVESLARLRAFIASFPALDAMRGRAYYNQGRVSPLVADANGSVSALVNGSLRYAVCLARHGRAWVGSCSCPVGVKCKHIHATALALLCELSPAGTTEADIAAAAGGRQRPFVEHWRPILEDKLGRPLADDELAFLRRLAALFRQFQQSGILWPQDLARLGIASSEAGRGPYQPAFAGWWPADQPPGDPLTLWQYIAYDIETSGLAVPEFIQPITDTAPVRRAQEMRLRREAIGRWKQRFDYLGALAAAPPKAAEPSPVTPLDLRLRLQPGKWTLETRAAPDDPWNPASRSFLQGIVRADGRLFSFETSPAAFAFLALCQEKYRRDHSIDLKPSSPGTPAFLNRVFSHRLARTIVTGPDGEPLVFPPEPVRWRITRLPNRPRDYEFGLVRTDGRPLPSAALHLPGKPDFYLDGATVYRGPPPLDETDGAASAVVPSEVVERPEVLRTLRRFGARLPGEIEARFVILRLRPRLECALAKDFFGRETLTVSLFAVADDPPIEQVWKPSGWAWASAKNRRENSPDGRKIYEFDRATADTVAEHLHAFRLNFSPYGEHWTRRLGRSFADEFLAWRATLPAGTEVLAAGELASLLGAPVRARVDFDLIESAAHHDWFDLALVLRPEDVSLTPDEIALLLKARGKFVRLPGKGWRRLEVRLDDAQAAALAAAGLDATEAAEAALNGERHRFHTLQLAQCDAIGALSATRADALRARARELTLPAAPPLPRDLRAELRPYQHEGFRFLAFLSANRLGGVLADDMGLGKTVQTLTWLLWLAEQMPAGDTLRALVVCPKSVQAVWESESARFAPALAVTRFRPALARASQPAVDGRPQLLIANYAQLRLQAEFLQARRWHAVILDEGQFIKNPVAQTTRIARELPGEHRLVLTGTPIENRLLDLWSLFSFALPGLLGTQAAFQRHYADDAPDALARLRGRVRHFLLRRTKAQVAAELPPRTEEDVLVELDGEQAKLYAAELKRARAQLLKIKTDRQLDRARFNILASLLRLRQICCHPALLDPAHRNISAAKLDALLERIEELRDEGHQVLVFSQFVEMLELIRARLTAAGIGHLLLTGRTEDRDALVARFQSDRSHTVFLLSLRAAGFGLNLTAASYVILYDPWWNPAVEAQAIDRTHRIGQTLPVTAYRLIARDTIEEKIRALHREKAAIARAIVQEESLASILDIESLRFVLG